MIFSRFYSIYAHDWIIMFTWLGNRYFPYHHHQKPKRHLEHVYHKY